MSQGFFSLIQYCPDASRAETANVGILIFQTEPPSTLVRIVDDVGPAMKRLGRRDHTATLLSVVQSMRNRIELEGFRSLEALEKFVRTRANQIRLTMPRPMRIQEIEKDIDEMFAELVAAPETITAEAIPKVPNLLAQTFARMAQRLPARVLISPELHVRGRDIAIRADYAYKNGCWNVVQEMPRHTGEKADDKLQLAALGLSKKGELVRKLEEGEGKLVVVSTQVPASEKTAEREDMFGQMLSKLGHAEFVRGADLEKFTKRVESDLAGHRSIDE